MEYFAEIDVSLEQSSVCVVDGAGKIVRETKVAASRRPWSGSSAVWRSG
jgi:hypothetical protein